MKTLKTSLFFLIFFFVINIISAQDYIILKNGDEIKSKVLEISTSEIKYKKFENIDGPTIVILKSTVFMIKYKNGTKDIINTMSENQQEVSNSPSKETNKENSNVSQVNETFKDVRDGKVYKTVKIGTQTWMAENLAYKANSGCWAYGNDQSNVPKYGYLYDWETAKNVCPSGWHLPTVEWETLTSFLGGKINTGAKIKEVGALHWDCNNKRATNESGFTALPGGYRISYGGSFGYIGNNGYWWSPVKDSSSIASYRYIGYGTNNLFSTSYSKHSGFSVRCIRD